LQQGDPADFIIVDNLEDFNVMETYIDGIQVARQGKSAIEPVPEKAPNKFYAREITYEDLKVYPQGKFVRVIEALDGQLITHELDETMTLGDAPFESDVNRDILKIVVLNRYEPAKPAIGFVRNFGLKAGAIASTVAHDSHNIIVVGTTDEAIMKAVNSLVAIQGGVCCVRDDDILLLPLPVAGLMSNGDGYQVASAYERITRMAQDLGSELRSPFMTLSFMALLVIPELKLSDKGLFDGKTFSFTTVFTS
jgi:adenine deaminase